MLISFSFRFGDSFSVIVSSIVTFLFEKDIVGTLSRFVQEFVAIIQDDRELRFAIVKPAMES